MKNTISWDFTGVSWGVSWNWSAILWKSGDLPLQHSSRSAGIDYGYLWNLWIMVICRTEVRTLVGEFGCAPWALGENSNHWFWYVCSLESCQFVSPMGMIESLVFLVESPFLTESDRNKNLQLFQVGKSDVECVLRALTVIQMGRHTGRYPWCRMFNRRTIYREWILVLQVTVDCQKLQIEWYPLAIKYG